MNYKKDDLVIYHQKHGEMEYMTPGTVVDVDSKGNVTIHIMVLGMVQAVVIEPDQIDQKLSERK